MIGYTVVNVTYGQVFGTELPLGEAVTRLQAYPLREILELLTRADAALSLGSMEDSAQGQTLLMRHLVPPRLAQNIQRFIERYRATEAHPAPLVLFHELQVLNALKLALMHCSEHVPAAPEDPGRLIEALLIINNHLGASVFDPASFGRLTAPAQTQTMIRYLIPNMIFHRSTRLAHVVARWNDLMFRDAAQLRHRPDFVDIPATLTQVLGLDADLFYRFVNALMMHPLAITRDTLFTEPFPSIALHMPTWLRSFNIGPAEYNPILDTVAGTHGWFRGELSRREWEPYYFVQMQVRPFLRLGDLVFCLSRRFATEKLSLGLYHLVLTHHDEQLRDRFQSFFGKVFESYVNRLLDRSYPVSPLACRFFPNPADLSTGNELIDAVVDYGDALIVIESKGNLFSLPVIVNAQPEILERQLKDIVFDAATQLDAAINRIRSGALRYLGIDPSRIRTYFPVVTTLQFVPIEHFLYGLIEDVLQSRHLLRERGVAPLQMLSVDDLEWIESFVQSGVSLAELLHEKTREARSRELTFKNFALEHLRPAMQHPNAYLQQRTVEIQDEVISYFRSRARTSGNTS